MTRDEIDARRDALYQFIVQYKQAHGGATPRVRDMSAAVGFPTSIVHGYLMRMVRDGQITIVGEGKSRHIGIPGERWIAPS